MSDDLKNLSKEEMVKLLVRGMVSYDTEGLSVLIKEFLEKCTITTYTASEYKVKDSHRNSAAYKTNSCILRPVPVVVVRKAFAAWAEIEKKNKDLDAWINDQSDKMFGMALSKAGVERIRFNEGIRYCMKFPGALPENNRRRA